MHLFCPEINHVFFADETIIFSSERKANLQAILATMESYERVSGQYQQEQLFVHPWLLPLTYLYQKSLRNSLYVIQASSY